MAATCTLSSVLFGVEESEKKAAAVEELCSR